MLSTFAVRSGVFGGLLKNQAPRVLAVVPVGSRPATSSSAVATKPPAEVSVVERIKQWDEANKIFYGPERDTKNFPHPIMPVESGRCRMGFVPEEWFKFMYEKTGVTGPYLFGVGLVTTLLSKEIWVIDHGFAEVLGFYGAVILLTKQLGAKMGNWMDKRNDAVNEERFLRPIREAVGQSKDIVKDNEKAIWREEGQKYLWEAKRENVALQMEAAYRQRLHEVYRQVKSRLDYQLEMTSVKRHFEQDHMVNWIVWSVKKSITPQQEEASIRECISNLRRLSGVPAPKAPAPA